LIYLVKEIDDNYSTQSEIDLKQIWIKENKENFSHLSSCIWIRWLRRVLKWGGTTIEIGCKNVQKSSLETES